MLEVSHLKQRLKTSPDVKLDIVKLLGFVIVNISCLVIRRTTTVSSKSLLFKQINGSRKDKWLPVKL